MPAMVASGAARTWQVRLQVPWAWVLAAALVAGAELAVRRLEAGGRLHPDRAWDATRRIRGFETAAAASGGADVALCGSSTVARLDPVEVARALGGAAPARVADASFPGANTAVTAYSIERLVLDRLRPRVVVYGLDTQSVNEHGLRRREQARLLVDLRTLAEDPVRWALLWWWRDRSALYRWQFTLREWIVRPWSARLAQPAPPDAAPAPARAWTIASSPHVFDAEKDHVFGPSAEAEIRRIAAACREAGVRLVLANMPLPPEYAGYWPDGRLTYDRYRGRLAALAAALGAPLIDLDDGTFAHDDFSDSHHLAGEGARRASAALGTALRELGVAGRDG